MKRNVIVTCDQFKAYVSQINLQLTEQQLTGQNRKSGRLKSKNGYGMLRSIGKQSGESVESVQEKKR